MCVYIIPDIYPFIRKPLLQEITCISTHIRMKRGLIIRYIVREHCRIIVQCRRETSSSKCLTLTITINRSVMHSIAHDGSTSEDDIEVHGTCSSSSSSASSLSSSTSLSSTSLSSTSRCNALHVEPP